METKTQEPWEWLDDYLSKNGKTEAGVVMTAARTAGYTKRDMKIACLTCNVRKTSSRTSKRVYWELWRLCK